MLCQICSGANANYGYKGGIKQFCSICAKTIPNTCNLTRKLCKEENCLKEPSFNYEGVSGKLYCATHKLPGMIRNDTNKCIYTNNDVKCTIIPTYGIQGEKAKYCFEHSKLFENMIREYLIIIVNGKMELKFALQELVTILKEKKRFIVIPIKNLE